MSFGPFTTITSENVARCPWRSLAKLRLDLRGAPSYVLEVLLGDAAEAAITHTVVDRGYTNFAEFPL